MMLSLIFLKCKNKIKLLQYIYNPAFNVVQKVYVYDEKLP